MNNIYHVFYHYPCNDGEVSRVVWEYFKPNSKFYKWRHNSNQNEINIINNLPEKSNIVFLDITPIIDKLSHSHEYIIIDHHKNALLSLINKKENLPMYSINIYTQKGFPENNDLSGCMLTWLYFTEEDFPSVVYYVGSKDVWNYSNPNTEKYCIGLNNHVKNSDDNKRINFIKQLLTNNSNDEQFINIGTILINYYKDHAKNIFKNYSFDYFDKLSIIDVKCSNTLLYKYLIEYAQEHFEECDILRILHFSTEHQLTYSLRSLKDHIKVDVMARYYGGNGHEKAAGYSVDIL